PPKSIPWSRCATTRCMEMLRLSGLDRSYKTHAGVNYVLRRISLEIREGEFVTIMGPSGAGKTTLLSILGMLDDGWTGDFFFLDQPVHQFDRKKRAELSRRYIGFVFQKYHLLDHLTVQENIDVPLSYRDVPRAERAAIVGDILDRFQIVGKKDLFPNQLSGGQQQLVGIARAIAANPRIILADEPTGNLHSSQAKEIMELFRRLNQDGTSIVQVTHSEANAAYGDRVIRLRDGWLTSDTPVRQHAEIQS
ncbi:MAG TPA: ABC transporter ATP-binding protein, partial [Pyrinomonadaceae bacterium]|nr:ABC transporter ATP-binding protein [Pyrinomonadaceae bacterium]